MADCLDILVAEDDPCIAAMLADILDDLGHRVVGVVDTADGAIDLTAGKAIDVAVIDVAGPWLQRPDRRATPDRPERHSRDRVQRACGRPGRLGRRCNRLSGEAVPDRRPGARVGTGDEVWCAGGRHGDRCEGEDVGSPGTVACRWVVAPQVYR